MRKPNRYPDLSLQSKNELAKRLSHKRFSKLEAQGLINDVLLNHESYYRDSRHSEPEKDKYVRNAKGTPLGSLLKRINEEILAPSDYLLPKQIFGGVRDSNHLMAAQHLLGSRRKRSLLALDISSFFEQISDKRVRAFLRDKCGCSDRAAIVISRICCVPSGAKGSKSATKTIGRGFATSSRLAIWCNLDTFIALNRLVEKRLKGHDPRLAIYVDDIGITASRVPIEKMEALAGEVSRLLAEFDPNQPLPENQKKRRISSYRDGMQHLGVILERNRLRIGAKTKSKLARAKTQIRKAQPRAERSKAKRKYNGLRQYRTQVEAQGR